MERLNPSMSLNGAHHLVKELSIVGTPLLSPTVPYVASDGAAWHGAADYHQVDHQQS